MADQDIQKGLLLYYSDTISNYTYEVTQSDEERTIRTNDLIIIRFILNSIKRYFYIREFRESRYQLRSLEETLKSLQNITSDTQVFGDESCNLSPTTYLICDINRQLYNFLFSHYLNEENKNKYYLGYLLGFYQYWSCVSQYNILHHELDKQRLTNQLKNLLQIIIENPKLSYYYRLSLVFNLNKIQTKAEELAYPFEQRYADSLLVEVVDYAKYINSKLLLKTIID